MIALDKPEALRSFYRRHLLEDVVPFWEKFGPEAEAGMLRTCIGDDGSVLSDDVYLWSQLRAVWTFSALWNRIEQRNEWLEIAGRLVAFCAAHGRDDRGYWRYRLGPSGEPR